MHARVMLFPNQAVYNKKLPPAKIWWWKLIIKSDIQRATSLYSSIILMDTCEIGWPFSEILWYIFSFRKQTCVFGWSSVFIFYEFIYIWTMDRDCINKCLGTWRTLRGWGHNVSSLDANFTGRPGVLKIWLLQFMLQ